MTRRQLQPQYPLSMEFTGELFVDVMEEFTQWLREQQPIEPHILSMHVGYLNPNENFLVALRVSVDRDPLYYPTAEREM